MPKSRFLKVYPSQFFWRTSKGIKSFHSHPKGGEKWTGGRGMGRGGSSAVTEKRKAVSSFCIHEFGSRCSKTMSKPRKCVQNLKKSLQLPNPTILPTQGFESMSSRKRTSSPSPDEGEHSPISCSAKWFNVMNVTVLHHSTYIKNACQHSNTACCLPPKPFAGVNKLTVPVLAVLLVFVTDTDSDPVIE
jgi:hypothetical protein